MLELLFIYAMSHNLSPHLVYSVIQTESGWDRNKVGIKHEVGLMQLNPKSFPSSSIKKLKTNSRNIMIGIDYLSMVKQKCKHKDRNAYVICYNRGVTGGSLVEDYHRDVYYRKVMNNYRNIMSKFKPDQVVYVINARVNDVDAWGKIVKLGREPETLGKWIVDIDGVLLPVEPERMMLEEEYFQLRKLNGK